MSAEIGRCKEVRWLKPNTSSPYMALGRNGRSYCIGVKIYVSSVRTVIVPINSKNQETKCEIEVPTQKIEEVIQAIKELTEEVNEHYGF